ncbi:MAG: two-component system, chemotaxis family, chemotaxis protein CheV [Desulfovibrionales bacterium]|jgi:two-component system chemotaxis response regulator CheV|nr:two-component system, chemotaxis family, chemotaxis protein CheV [Desulfovibrionales bacterium]
MSRSETLLEVGTNELEIIEFFIDETPEDGGEPIKNHFGVNVAKVLEVIESPQLEAQPSAPHPCFMGTIPLRDKILPVLDLSVWLDIPRAQHPNEVILVTEFYGKITGFLSSGVTQIHRLSWGEVNPPSKYIESVHGNCVNGMVRIEDRFVLMLDFERILAELDPDFDEKAGETAVHAREKYRALMADDSKAVRAMLKNKLEAANFEVLLVNDGLEAWETLNGLREKAQSQGEDVTDLVDIVVSDIEMPRMDGYTLTKRIKDDSQLNRLPVILFSSLIRDDLRHKGVSVGADDQITKPEFDSLAERAVNLVEGRKAREKDE